MFKTTMELKGKLNVPTVHTCIVSNTLCIVSFSTGRRGTYMLKDVCTLVLYQ